MSAITTAQSHLMKVWRISIPLAVRKLIIPFTQDLSGKAVTVDSLENIGSPAIR